MHKAFVYGTLREKDVEATHYVQDYILCNYGPFPYVEYERGDDNKVYGNIIEVDDEGLAALDKYENIVKGLFRRTSVHCCPIVDPNGENPWPECFIYAVGPALLPPRIESGDWFKR